ncbi:MAG TPA: erythromycin esterase family protein [Spirochaetia bacterium]|nr:erythromycin esterase family protein [Spirochaetia bacterium]
MFKLLVERYGVRGFALEGDYGGCERVNRYIHGGEGTAREAAAAIGFAIYRTEEMAELIMYMRRYNEGAAEGDDLRFYGFDMQRYRYSVRYLIEACATLSVDTGDMERLMDGDGWSDAYDVPARMATIDRVKAELTGGEASAEALHLADMLVRYCELQDPSNADGALRDRLMAENVLWIAERELEAGRDRVFVSGHNGHVARWGSYDSMGKLLAKAVGDGYYAIGTDFYRTRCNLPRSSSGRRTKQVFYSHDPLAKAANEAGLDTCWLDFSRVAESPELAELTSRYLYMGNLGERYAWIMRLLPPSYRMFQPPATLYDGMIYVAEATPTDILGEE